MLQLAGPVRQVVPGLGRPLFQRGVIAGVGWQWGGYFSN